ncbi:phosphatase PAP2 family protein [Vibrio salinus]|uniref:phosphatase PAP2 family protein n=1 Tax=Vibrio salinus TaxID=2899784 RepID=UPI001E5E6060|nr:phosphatase PAP2 family protein [Vibrio salinus]MCE0494088.1 phosphatase PAP2 family protein [Vibrio salinus]
MRVMEPIVRFDLAFSLFCLQNRFYQQIAKMSKWISHSGDGHLYALAGLYAYLFDGSRGQAFLITGIIAFAIELPSYIFLKRAFQRRRPQEFSSQVTAYITPSDRFSLPSGHTTAAFLMASIISFYYPVFSVFAFTWACCVGMARILLGVHFFTDIAIGILLGLCCAQMGLIGFEEWFV